MTDQPATMLASSRRNPLEPDDALSAEQTAELRRLEADPDARARVHSLANASLCAACGGNLSVSFVWGALEEGGGWQTRCREDVRHSGTVSRQEIARALGGEGRALAPSTSAQLARIDEQQMARRVEVAAPMWREQATREQKQQLALLAMTYGLDPLSGELVLYQGKPYISIDGRTRIAHEARTADDRPALRCPPQLRPIIDPQEKVGMGFEPDDIVYEARVARTDKEGWYVDYGRVSMAERTAKAQNGGLRSPVVSNNPALMAQKRARHRVLRAAFPIPIPGLEEAGEVGDVLPATPRPSHVQVVEAEARPAVAAPASVPAPGPTAESLTAADLAAAVHDLHEAARYQAEQSPTAGENLTERQLNYLKGLIDAVVGKEGRDVLTQEVFERPLETLTRAQASVLIEWARNDGRYRSVATRLVARATGQEEMAI